MGSLAQTRRYNDYRTLSQLFQGDMLIVLARLITNALMSSRKLLSVDSMLILEHYCLAASIGCPTESTSCLTTSMPVVTEHLTKSINLIKNISRIVPRSCDASRSPSIESQHEATNQ